MYISYTNLFFLPQIRRNAIEQTSKKTIRLIHRGQLLKDDEKTLFDYGIRNNSIFIHCALSDPIIPTNTITSTETVLQKKVKKRKLNDIIFHAKHFFQSVSGFDKLSESGYNDEEIRSIRTQFHLHASPDYIDGGMWLIHY